MSRGPGKWQRRILELAAEADWFYLIDVMPERHTRSDYVAARRAAWQLKRRGRIDLQWWQGVNRLLASRGPYRLVVMRPGAQVPNLLDAKHMLEHVRRQVVCRELGIDESRLRLALVRGDARVRSAYHAFKPDRDMMEALLPGGYVPHALSVAPAQHRASATLTEAVQP